MSDSDRGNRIIAALVMALFFLSGACGLVYEVAWTRMFSVVAGGTTRALTAVLVAYMSGLALGGFLGGRYVDRRAKRPVMTYGVLEGLVGGLAVIIAFAIPWLVPVLKVGKSALGPHPVLFDLYRFTVSAAVLLAPTTLMGATFPILLRGVLRSRERFGFTAGYLYASNTLGAVTGSLVSGFILIPATGLRAATFTAAGVNLFILGLVFALPWLRDAGLEATALKESVKSEAPEKGGRGLAWAVLIGYGASGLCAMVYQVGWARALSLSLGNTTYALGLIFAAYIGGLALGGLAMTPLVDRLRRPLAWAAGLEMMIGLTAVAVMPLFAWVTARMFNWALLFQNEFGAFQLLRFLAAFGLIVLPTFAMGALFPVMVRLMGSLRPGVGEPAGQIYAANTAGAIAGAFLAGHVLIAWLEVQNTLLFATGLSIIIGIVWLLFTGLRSVARLAGSAAAAAVVIGAVLLVPRWDPILMNSGPYLYADTFKSDLEKGADIREVLHNYFDVLFHREGVETTASVLKLRATGEIFLRINGKTDASSMHDMATQVLSAHLPLLMHPDPKKVMILGLASGVTAGSALIHPLERLECLEISPEVVAASKFFEPFSNLKYDDPRFHLIVDDARNYLSLSDARYDVIILEPSNPWVAGMSALFTREVYGLIRDHLEPGGISLNFIPAYDMDVPTLRMALRTISAAFPYVTLWEIAPLGDYFILGSDRPIKVDPEILNRRAAEPRLAADLKRVDARDGVDLLARFVMGNAALRAASGTGAFQTDDRRQFEFVIPKLKDRSYFERITGIITQVLALHEPAGELIVPGGDIGGLLTQFDDARRLYYRAFTISNIQEMDLTDLEFAIQAWRNDISFCGGRFPAAFAGENLAAMLTNRAEVRLQAGDGQGGVADLEEAFDLDPGKVMPAEKILDYYMSTGDLAKARVWATKSLYRYPEDTYALHALGNIAISEGKFAEAEQYFRKGIKSTPRDPELQWKLGLVLASQGRLDEAEAQLKQMVREYPDLVEPKILLANVLLDEDRAAEADPYIRKARKIAPNHPLLKKLEKKYPAQAGS